MQVCEVNVVVRMRELCLTGASTIKVPVTSVSRYGCTRGRICRSSKGEGDRDGGLRRPPGSTAGSLTRTKLSYRSSQIIGQEVEYRTLVCKPSHTRGPQPAPSGQWAKERRQTTAFR